MIGNVFNIEWCDVCEELGSVWLSWRVCWFVLFWLCIYKRVGYVVREFLEIVLIYLSRLLRGRFYICRFKKS